MRYEVYGVSENLGFVEFVGAFPSYRKAGKAVHTELNHLRTPFWLILEMQRKASVPIGLVAGEVKNGAPFLSRAPHLRMSGAPGKSEILSEDYLKDILA